MMKKNLKCQRNIISLKALTEVAFIDFLRSSDLKKSSSHYQFARGKQKSDGRVNIECRLQPSLVAIIVWVGRINIWKCIN